MITFNRVKKILIFSIAYYPHVGGAEIAVKEITDRIFGFNFDMITLRLDRKSPDFEKIGNINVYRIGGPKFLFPITACIKAVRLHRKNNYNLIWSIMAAYAGFAVLFFSAISGSASGGKHSKIPFLLTLQEGDPEEHILKRVGIFYPLWKRIFKKANYIQAISNYLADFAKKYGAKCLIEIVPNGVDLKKFKSQTCPTARRVSNLKNKEDIILITTSRLMKKNAVGDIIEALKYLPENVKLWIIGDGPEKQNLKFKIKNLKLENKVFFFGYLEHEEMIKYIQDADIFVRPSLSEGLGNSFLEAMAVGLPVIATPVGGITDFLKDPSNSSGQAPTGLFCEVRNPESIAKKVKIYLDNPELREKIIRNAKEMVEKNYNWDLIAEEMKNILVNYENF